MLDGEPVFRDRMKAIGVSDAFQLALIAAGITALARLAFSSASMPGSGDDQPSWVYWSAFRPLYSS